MKSVKIISIVGILFLFSMCKEKANLPTEGKNKTLSLLSTPYTYSYIIVKQGEDTINLSIGNPFIAGTGIDFALNNLNAIKGTIETDTILYFVPEGRKNAFLNKIKATIKKINENEIEEARDKIINDVLPHAKEWVRGSGRYAVIRALEGAIRGLENPYGNFVYEPLGNSVSGLIDYSYQIQINQTMKIRLPDGTYKIIEGDFAGKITVVEPPIVQITGDQLNYLINEYEKDPYWKEAFRFLKEKGFVDTSVMKEVYCFASLSNSFYPPTIMGEYSGIVIIWPTQVDSGIRVSDFVFATDGNISNAYVSTGVPQYISPDSVRITNVEWWEFPEGGGPIMGGVYIPPKSGEIMTLPKVWCLVALLLDIYKAYIIDCWRWHENWYEYWDCVRFHLNSYLYRDLPFCVLALTKGGC
jgi:hypothetical protein